MRVGRTLWLVLLVSMVLANSAKVVSAQESATGQAAAASSTEEAEAAEEAGATPADAIIEGRSIVTVYESIAGFSPEQRAERIAQRIIEVARQGKIAAEEVGAERHAEWTEIRAGDKLIMIVTDKDAHAAGKSREALVAENAGNIRQAILSYRHDHSWRSLLRGLTYTVLLTVLLIPFLWLLRKVRIRLGGALENWVKVRTKAEGPKSAWQVGFTYALSLLLAVAAVFRWILILAVLQGYLTVTMSFFPYTRSISWQITGWLASTLSAAAKSALEYVPNVAVIAVIIAIASQVVKLVTMFFREIEKGNLALRGFYADWAEPTAKLIRIMIFVLVAIAIFPYLPGSKSPAFQGVSIFVGLLLSLGSSSAVANGIAGIILTYMRSFVVGDWVKIGDTIGEVVEKNILVTRILTMKQEVITIPNATVMSGAVMNYTREAKHNGVIFHTTVTIGYDAPWKTVHQLLIDAAHGTKHVRAVPEAFVLQTALNDFYVAYELNAYTDQPREMQYIYSELHQNIQDKFNEAGVEICSPHFSALRDGNAIAIPGQYVPDDYRAPGFRMMEKRDKGRSTGHAAD